MIDDAVLAREAHLIYQNAFGFEPEKGDMTRWKGVVRDSLGKEVELTLLIPSSYPDNPPEFHLPKDVQHPIVGSGGTVITRSISRWRPNFHIFQVIREVRQAIASANFEMRDEQISTKSSDDVLRRQLNYLRNELSAKKEEYERLKQTPVSHAISQEGTQQTVSEVNEDALINIQNELWGLEDQYDTLEIDGVEFAKKFLKLQKRYYMISKSS